MKPITTAEQPWLSFKRTIDITIDGIRYRLFRASVTVAIIILAVAFLTNVLAEGLIKSKINAHVTERQTINQRVYDWSARLATPGDTESLLEELAMTKEGSRLFRECRQLTDMNDSELTQLCRQSQSIVVFLDFLNRLDYAKRRSLVHTAEGLAVLQWLRLPRNMASFQQALGTIHSVKCPLSQDELNRMLDDFPAMEIQLKRILDARAQAIQTLSRHLAGRPLLEALCETDSGFGSLIRQAGFMLDSEEAALISRQARAIQDELLIESLLEVRLIRQTRTHDGSTSSHTTQPVRQFLAQASSQLPSDVTTLDLWTMLESPRNARLLSERLHEMQDSSSASDDVHLEALPPHFLRAISMPPERFVELAESRREASSLEKAARLIGVREDVFFGLDERMAWLLVISLLVCGVGITNAMMMSVTERFKEIATLKCLGALDGFIMLMFVLESSAMGLVGGCLGALFGGLIGFIRMLFAFGPEFFSAMPIGNLFLGMGASVLIGTILAAVAAIIPSFKAARLAPMEAMRVE